MSSPAAVIVLQLCAALLVLAEFALPSGGILGIAAAAAFVGSWAAIVANLPDLVALFVAADLLLAPVLVWLGIKAMKHSPMANKSELRAEEGYQVNFAYPESWVGAEAKTVDHLRPAGHVRVEGQVVEAIGESEYIDPGRRVRIVSVSENKIIVVPLEDEQ